MKNINDSLESILQRLQSEYRAALRDFQFDFIDNRLIPAMRREMEEQEALPEQFFDRVRTSLEETFVDTDEERETCLLLDRHSSEVFDLDLTDFQRYVLAYVQLQDEDGDGVHVSQRDLAGYAKTHGAPYCSKGYISDAFRTLEKEGCIERERVKGNRTLKTRVLRTLPDPEKVLREGNSDEPRNSALSPLS